MKTIGWGIIGVGEIAAGFAKALEGLLNESQIKGIQNKMGIQKDKQKTVCATLVAVASKDEKKSAAFAKTWNIQAYYSDQTAQITGRKTAYEQLFSDPNIDIVYIAAAHNLRAKLSMQALKAGKHVLCEKPAATNANEIEQIIACAKKENKFFMEALRIKSNPAIQTCLEWIREGRIGDVLHIKADFCFAAPVYEQNAGGESPVDYEINNCLFSPALAGGAFLAVGVYPLVMAMLGAGVAPNSISQEDGVKTIRSKTPCCLPKAIHAVSRKSPSGIDLWNGVSLRFGNSEAKHITAQLSSAIDMGGEIGFQDAYIVGKKGKIKIPLFAMATSAEMYTTEYNTDTLIEKVECDFVINGYEYEGIHVMECLEQSIIESPIHTFSDMKNVYCVLDECRRQTASIIPCDQKKDLAEKSNLALKEKSEESSAKKSTGEDILMYTDGACSGNPGPGGWGVVLIADEREVFLSGGEKMTTNNRMELQAAIQGLSHIVSIAEWRMRPVKVFIDSQYVKNGITQWIAGWKRNGWKTASKQTVKNQDLWVQLDALACELDISWTWVKGHAGNKYNEMCDQLAVKAGKKAAQG